MERKGLVKLDDMPGLYEGFISFAEDEKTLRLNAIGNKFTRKK